MAQVDAVIIDAYAERPNARTAAFYQGQVRLDRGPAPDALPQIQARGFLSL